MKLMIAFLILVSGNSLFANERGNGNENVVCRWVGNNGEFVPVPRLPVGIPVIFVYSWDEVVDKNIIVCIRKRSVR